MVAFKLRLKMQNTRMQFQINDNVQLAQSLNPLNDVVKFKVLIIQLILMTCLIS